MPKAKGLDGTEICYDIDRQKSDCFLFFVHGAGGSLNVWKKEREYFRDKGLSTLAIDLRGHGLSDRPTKAKDYTLKKFAEDINTVIGIESITEFILVGHCFGGMISVEFHKLFPNMAKSYVLVGTGSKAPQKLRVVRTFGWPILLALNILLRLRSWLPSRGKDHRESFDKFVGTSDWNLMRIYSDISHTSFHSWLYTYENLANFDGTNILKEITVPVLIIQGENDQIFTLDCARRTNSLVSTSVLDVVPGGNHITVINDPIILAEKIYTFCKKII
ncbi:MAG: alpha/beta hydrolase [Patescibacteria group bacterium]|jgi:pimeloyl-ACP methyl ester carboxylesterase